MILHLSPCPPGQDGGYHADYTGVRKQKKKRGFKLQREAKEWERAFLEKQQGTPDMTFQALYDIYMEDMEHRLRESTIKNMESVYKERILPYFKDRPINAITPADIRAWQNIQIDKGYSDGYLLRIHKAMVTILNYAVRYYGLLSNPCSKAGGIGKPARSMQFWTLDQYNGFIQHIGDIRAKTALELLFYSGMQFGEMMALTLDDFDFTGNTISITKTFYQNTHTTGPPKTQNSVRCITMPISIMQRVQTYTTKIYGIKSSDRVFTFTDSLVKGNIKRGAEEAGIPRIRIHDLRHPYVKPTTKKYLSKAEIPDYHILLVWGLCFRVYSYAAGFGWKMLVITWHFQYWCWFNLTNTAD